MSAEHSPQVFPFDCAPLQAVFHLKYPGTRSLRHIRQEGARFVWIPLA